MSTPQQALTIQQKITSVRTLLDKSKEQIAMALPRHMTAERVLRVAMTAIQRTPQLLDCTQRSLIGSIVQASQLGLETDGVLGHAYLVPFNNRKTGQTECQLIPGYKGLIDLSRRSGQLSTVFAEIVYENDTYDFCRGTEPKIDHKPTKKETTGPMVAAYAVAKLRDGAVQFEWMWKRQIDAIRKGSKASNNGPWQTHYEEMAKKTVLRRLSKLLPMSVEMQKAVSLDELNDVGISQGLSHVVDFPQAALEDKSELEQLTDQMTVTNGNGEAESPDDNPADAPPREPGDEPTVEYDLSEFEFALGEATGMKAIGEIELAWAAKVPAKKAAIAEACERKRNEIRSTRGERAERAGA